jgi:hypothetical protein
MAENNQGLTDTYNLLKDIECEDKRILELRGLHEELDRVVLTAYGWDDIEVPAYTTPTPDAEREVLEHFEDEVIDRLFILNAERSTKERLNGSKRVREQTQNRRMQSGPSGGEGSLFDNPKFRA